MASPLKDQKNCDLKVRVNDIPITIMEPLDDPFVNTELVIGKRDLWKHLFRRGPLKINFVVGGNKQALWQWFNGPEIPKESIDEQPKGYELHNTEVLAANPHPKSVYPLPYEKEGTDGAQTASRDSPPGAP